MAVGHAYQRAGSARRSETIARYFPPSEIESTLPSELDVQQLRQLANDGPAGGAYFSVLFEGNGNVAIGGKANLVPFDVRHQADIDVVMMVGLVTLPTIVFGHLDAAALDAVDGADMDAVGSDNLHMRLDLACIHEPAPPGDNSPIGNLVQRLANGF
jgi:hypothetical protein